MENQPSNSIEARTNTIAALAEGHELQSTVQVLQLLMDSPDTITMTEAGAPYNALRHALRALRQESCEAPLWPAGRSVDAALFRLAQE